MNIKEKFIELTSRTYPHRTESLLESFLPKGYKKDDYGNYYYLIGQDPTTMFTCHLDTASKSVVNVKHVFDENIIKTDGGTILGADDKAGMVVILNMIENNVPGLYYFFIGEEVGCIGSRALSDYWTENEFSDTITKVVSFDRKSDHSVITHQMCDRCCSDEFAIELSDKLNNAGYDLKFSPDDEGLLTDSFQFMELVPECTNISVGYMNEHTNDECQDIDFLERLCKAVCEIDWEDLPVVRDPFDVEEYDYDDYYDPKTGEYKQIFLEDCYFYETEDEDSKIYLSKYLIRKEKELISEYLLSHDYKNHYELDMTWNGRECSIKFKDVDDVKIIEREYLMNRINGIKTFPVRHIRRNINDDVFDDGDDDDDVF
jgi:hypothetical protein